MQISPFENSMEYKEASELLQQNWGINPTNMITIPLGNALCWKITTDKGEDLFFKQMRPEIVGSEVRIEEILEVQNYFASQGLPVVKPSATQSGNLYILNNGSFFIVYPFIQSKQKTHPSDLNQRNLDSLSETLAKLHHAGSKPEAPTISKIFGGWKSIDRFKSRIASVRDEIEKRKVRGQFTNFEIEVLRGLEVKERMIVSADKDYEEFGLQSDTLTHGDYHERNVYFNENDDVEWIIDLDACEMAPRSRELARAIDLLCIDRSDLSIEGLARAKAFSQKYNSIFPISKEELYKGWYTQLMMTGMSLFGYTDYYLNNSAKSKRFIEDEKAEELEKYFNKLEEVVNFICYNPKI